MLAYGAALVLVGVIAFFAAPEGARAQTALIIPSFCFVILALVAGLTYLGARPGGRPILARIFGHLGMALPVLFALLFLMPAMGRTRAWQNHEPVTKEYQAALAAGSVEAGDDARKAFFRERKAAEGDITYLIVTLWTLIALSIVAAGVLAALGMQVRRAARAESSAAGA